MSDTSCLSHIHNIKTHRQLRYNSRNLSLSQPYQQDLKWMLPCACFALVWEVIDHEQTLIFLHQCLVSAGWVSRLFVWHRHSFTIHKLSRKSVQVCELNSQYAFVNCPSEFLESLSGMKYIWFTWLSVCVLKPSVELCRMLLWQFRLYVRLLALLVGYF